MITWACNQLDIFKKHCFGDFIKMEGSSKPFGECVRVSLVTYELL